MTMCCLHIKREREKIEKRKPKHRTKWNVSENDGDFLIHLVTNAKKKYNCVNRSVKRNEKTLSPHLNRWPTLLKVVSAVHVWCALYF